MKMHLDFCDHLAHSPGLKKIRKSLQDAAGLCARLLAVPGDVATGPQTLRCITDGHVGEDVKMEQPDEDWPCSSHWQVREAGDAVTLAVSIDRTMTRMLAVSKAAMHMLTMTPRLINISDMFV